MPTYLPIDDQLLNRALEVCAGMAKVEIVNEALAEYVSRRERGLVVEAFGSVDYDDDYNAKLCRR